MENVKNLFTMNSDTHKSIHFSEAKTKSYQCKQFLRLCNNFYVTLTLTLRVSTEIEKK